MNKKTLFLALTGLTILPLVSFAAFNDATLTTDTVISAGGVNLNVSGSSGVVNSITVDANSFSFVLQSGSSLQVTSPDSKVLATDAVSAYIETDTCNTSQSILKHSSSNVGSVTVTITPSSSVCSGSSATSASAGGGGGIFEGSVPQKIKPRLQTIYPDGTIVYHDDLATADSVASSSIGNVVVENTQITQPPIGASHLFLKALKKGMENSDVSRLQTLLASDSSIYPEGLMTGYFGRLTQRAVERFQTKYGIVSSGIPSTTGYGRVGPQTRAKLNEVFGNGVASVEISPSSQTQFEISTTQVIPTQAQISAIFNKALFGGMTDVDVKSLQQLLNTNTDTQVAISGVGSNGEETDYFGMLTEKALQRFQTKYGIVSSGTPSTTGYGRVGPQTRAKLNEVFGN